MLMIPWWFIPFFIDAIGLYVAWYIARCNEPGAPVAAVAFVILLAIVTLPLWALCYAVYAHPIYSLLQ